MKPYLFSFQPWHSHPLIYILMYAESENKARIKAAKECRFNNGNIAQPKDLQCCTYGLDEEITKK